MHTEDGKNILKPRPSTFFPSIVLSYDKIIELLLIFHQTALQTKAELCCLVIDKIFVEGVKLVYRKIVKKRCYILKETTRWSRLKEQTPSGL